MLSVIFFPPPFLLFWSDGISLINRTQKQQQGGCEWPTTPFQRAEPVLLLNRRVSNCAGHLGRLSFHREYQKWQLCWSEGTLEDLRRHTLHESDLPRSKNFTRDWCETRTVSESGDGCEIDLTAQSRRLASESQFMRGCFSSPEVVEGEVPDSGGGERASDWNDDFSTWLVSKQCKELGASGNLRPTCKWRHFTVMIPLLWMWTVHWQLQPLFQLWDLDGASSPLHKAGQHLNQFKIHGKYGGCGNEESSRRSRDKRLCLGCESQYARWAALELSLATAACIVLVLRPVSHVSTGKTMAELQEKGDCAKRGGGLCFILNLVIGRR